LWGGWFVVRKNDNRSIDPKSNQLRGFFLLPLDLLDMMGENEKKAQCKKKIYRRGGGARP